jgi:N-acetylmuramoyl-L-alanine amidase
MEESAVRSIRWSVALLVVLIAGCAGRPSLYQKSLEGEIPTPQGRLEGRTVVLDPGHGGRFPGAVAGDGTREAEVNLGVARELAGLLRAEGARVRLTREQDVDLLGGGPEGSLRRDLLARVELAEEVAPDLFLSIHHNSRPGKVGDFNRTETYHRLGDPGPSRDAAVRIQQHLAAALELPDPPLLRAGNYLVLRHNSGTAVLGEASYLTSRGMGSVLRTAAAQRLEAEAYFLGILDYLRRGLPRLRVATPDGERIEGFDLGTAGTRWLAEVGADGMVVTPNSGLPAVEFLPRGGAGLDPQSVRAELDGRPLLPAVWDSRIALRSEASGLTPGAHRLRVSARNQRGNAAPRLELPLWVEAAVATLRLRLPHPLLQGGGAVPLLITARTAGGAAAADGTGIVLRVEGARVLAGPTKLRAGVARAWLKPLPDADRVRIEARAEGADAVEQAMFAVREPPAGRLPLVVHVLGRDGDLPGAWVELAGEVAITDALGRVLLQPKWRGDSRGDERHEEPVVGGEARARLRLHAAGYAELKHEVIPVKRSGFEEVGRTELICDMDPLAADLLGKRIVVDPGAGGDQAGVVDRCGGREADFNLAVGLLLADYLRRAGADVRLTREQLWEARSGVDRVLREGESAAALFLTLRHDLGAGAVRIDHYPSSRNGRRAAYLLGEELGAWIGGGAESVDGSEFTLLMTAAPALVVHLPLRGAGGTGAAAGAASLPEIGSRMQRGSCSPLLEPWYQRQEAWALFRGVVRYLRGEVPAVATLSEPVVKVASTTSALEDWRSLRGSAAIAAADRQQPLGTAAEGDQEDGLLLLEGALPLAPDPWGRHFRPWIPGRE